MASVRGRTAVIPSAESRRPVWCRPSAARAGRRRRWWGRSGDDGRLPSGTVSGRERIVGLIWHSDGRPDSPAPGVTRVTIVERATGAGALTTRLVTIQPGVTTPPHWHRVEEAMMVLEGEGKAVLGDQVMDIRAGATLLGPAGIPHGFINTGSVPMLL